MAYFSHFHKQDKQIHIPLFFVAYIANISIQYGRSFAYKTLSGRKKNRFCKTGMHKVLIFSVLFAFVCRKSSANISSTFPVINWFRAHYAIEYHLFLFRSILNNTTIAIIMPIYIIFVIITILSFIQYPVIRYFLSFLFVHSSNIYFFIFCNHYNIESPYYLYKLYI